MGPGITPPICSYTHAHTLWSLFLPPHDWTQSFLPIGGTSFYNKL